MSPPHPLPHRLGSRAPHTSSTPAATSKQTSSPVQTGVPALRRKASPQPATPRRQKPPWDPKACSAVTLKLRTNLLSRWGASTPTLSLLQGQVQLSKKRTPRSHVLSPEPPLQPCTLTGKLYPLAVASLLQVTHPENELGCEALHDLHHPSQLRSHPVSRPSHQITDQSSCESVNQSRPES